MFICPYSANPPKSSHYCLVLVKDSPCCPESCVQRSAAQMDWAHCYSSLQTTDNKKGGGQLIQPRLRQKKTTTPRLKYLERRAHSGEGVNRSREERKFDKQGCRQRGYHRDNHLILARWVSKVKSHSGLHAE